MTRYTRYNFDEYATVIIAECLNEPKTKGDLSRYAHENFNVEKTTASLFVSNLIKIKYIEIVAGEMWPTEKGLSYLYQYRPDLELDDLTKKIMFSDIPNSSEINAN